MNVETATAAAKKRDSEKGNSPEKKALTKDEYVLMSDLKEAVTECIKDDLKKAVKEAVNECIKTSLTEVKTGIEQVNSKLTNAESMFVDMKGKVDDHDAKINIHKECLDSHSKKLIAQKHNEEMMKKQNAKLDQQEFTLKQLQDELAELKDPLQADKNTRDGSTSTMASRKQSNAKDPCVYNEQDVKEVATKMELIIQGRVESTEEAVNEIMSQVDGDFKPSIVKPKNLKNITKVMLDFHDKDVLHMCRWEMIDRDND